jgi:hypothetical protein
VSTIRLVLGEYVCRAMDVSKKYERHYLKY